MTNDSKFTHEIKTKIVMTKAAFKRSLFATKLVLILMKKLLNYYNWSTVLCNAESWTLRSRSRKKVLNVVLEKKEKISWTDRVRKEEVLREVKMERNIFHTTKISQLTGLVVSCVGTGFRKTLLKER